MTGEDTGGEGEQADSSGSTNVIVTRQLVTNAFPTRQLVGNANHLGFNMEQSEGVGEVNGGEEGNGGCMGNDRGEAPIMEGHSGGDRVNGVHGVDVNGVGINNGVLEMENSYGVGNNNGGACGNGVGSVNGGNGGAVGTGMDGVGGGKELGTNPRCREAPVPKRRTLRGKRTKKKNISKEEEEMLATAMKRWLGKQNQGPEKH